MTDSAERPVCGSTDTDDGTPCQRTAGWGTDSDIGPCRDHPARGRPSKFTNERAQEVIRAAKKGGSFQGCANAAGVVRKTLINWLEENPTYKDRGGDYTEFLTGFARARWTGQERLIDGSLSEASDMDPSMARFLLKTSFGYEETERIEIEDVTDSDDGTTVEDLEAIFNE